MTTDRPATSLQVSVDRDLAASLYSIGTDTDRRTYGFVVRNGRVSRVAEPDVEVTVPTDGHTPRRCEGLRAAPSAEHRAVLARGDDERLRRTAQAFAIGVGELDSVPGVLVGGEDEMADQLRALRDATGISYVSVPTTHLDAVAPVIGQLSD
jgi:hypothetical protein